MIPVRYITEWGVKVPWIANKLVEQDLIICRALVSIYQDEFLAEHLASGAVRHCINYFCSRNRDIRKILILCR